MLVDSGSTVDLIDKRTLCVTRGRCPSLRLTPSRARVYTYGSRCPLPLRGQFFAKVSTGSTFRGGTRQQWMHPGSTNGHDATLAERGEEAMVNEAGEMPRRATCMDHHPEEEEETTEVTAIRTMDSR